MAPREVAESIYYDRFFVKPGLAPMISIDAAVAEELFDTIVNMGQARPSRWFQQSINELCTSRITVDGQIGKQTVTAYESCQQRIGATKLCVRMLDSLDNLQKAEYGRLERVNAKLSVFYNGWVKHRIGNVNRAKCGPTV